MKKNWKKLKKYAENLKTWLLALKFYNNVVDWREGIIARKPLHNLAYDMNEIYRLSKTRTVITLQQVYEENSDIVSEDKCKSLSLF